jgi:hypothetical protein
MSFCLASYKAFFLAGLFVAFAAASLSAQDADAVRLSAGQLRVAVDRASGGIESIANGYTGRTVAVEDRGGRLVFDGFEIDLGQLAFASAASTDGETRFRASAHGVQIERIYRVRLGGDYIDRRLVLVNRGAEPVVLKRAEDGVLRFGEPFQSTLYHDDNMTFDAAQDSNREVDATLGTALNVFLRQPGGGFFTGLKYPYWRPQVTLDSLALPYEPNFRIEPGSTLELPTFFLGAYRADGVIVRKQLHWKPRLISMEPNPMDLGEVRAMQRLMRDYLPLYPAPAKGYFLWLNSWWAVLGTPEEEAMQGEITPALVPAWTRLLDQVKASGAVDALNTAPVWVGLANYIGEPQTLAKVGPDARFPINDSIRQVLDHARSISVPLLGFADPDGRAYRADRPDWRLQPTFDPAVRFRANCHANPEYEQWFARLVDDTIAQTGIVGWAWDYHWMLRPALCFNPHHGHEIGNTEFEQYRNVTASVEQLRRAHPGLFIEIYWGLKEGGSWAHRGLNSLENVYENGNVSPPGVTRADDERFQMWFNQNYRFLPTYMNLAQINFDGNEPNGERYSILSALSGSHHGQLNEWIDLKDKAGSARKLEELAYWKRWAGEHLDYLDDRVTLFGMPARKDGIDGSAHILGDRGFVFVFNPWPGAEKWGAVLLGSLIGLEKGERFAVTEIGSRAPRKVGVYRRGDALVFPIAAKTALLFEVEPTEEPLSAPPIPAGVTPQPAFGK